MSGSLLCERLCLPNLLKVCQVGRFHLVSLRTLHDGVTAEIYTVTVRVVQLSVLQMLERAEMRYLHSVVHTAQWAV